MTPSRASSVGTLLTDSDAGSIKKVDPQPIKNVPMDHEDPNHPHNGDVEAQISWGKSSSCLSKRVKWTIILATLFLGTLAVAMVLGWWYGKQRVKKPDPPAPVFVTLNASTTSEFTTVQSTVMATATDMEAAFGVVTATTYITTGASPVPTGNDRVCVGQGVFSSKDDCYEHCNPTKDRPIELCEAHNGGWKCSVCRDRPPSAKEPEVTEAPPPDPEPSDSEEPCIVHGRFATKDECRDHCLPIADKEATLCDVHAGAWKCSVCRM